MEAQWIRGSSTLPQDFFRENGPDINRLLGVVTMYLSIPASAAKPERVWSYTGWIVTKQRIGLAVEMVEAMALIWDCLRQPFFEFDLVSKEVEKIVQELETAEAAKRVEKGGQKK